jgi:hypothetical protein
LDLKGIRRETGFCFAFDKKRQAFVPSRPYEFWYDQELQDEEVESRAEKMKLKPWWRPPYDE